MEEERVPTCFEAIPTASMSELPRAQPQLIETFVKSSAKMKRRYLTQRYMYDINRKRIDDQLKKRFGRPRPRTTESKNISFIMTVEAAYALRRLVRIEHCYENELIQPLPNRVAQVSASASLPSSPSLSLWPPTTTVSFTFTLDTNVAITIVFSTLQVVKIRVHSMRRAAMFLNRVSFKCPEEYAFMVPSGVCMNPFSGHAHEIHKLTEENYSDCKQSLSPPPSPSPNHHHHPRIPINIPIPTFSTGCASTPLER